MLPATCDDAHVDERRLAAHRDGLLEAGHLHRDRRHRGVGADEQLEVGDLGGGEAGQLDAHLVAAGRQVLEPVAAVLERDRDRLDAGVDLGGGHRDAGQHAARFVEHGALHRGVLLCDAAASRTGARARSIGRCDGAFRVLLPLPSQLQCQRCPRAERSAVSGAIPRTRGARVRGARQVTAFAKGTTLSSVRMPWTDLSIARCVRQTGVRGDRDPGACGRAASEREPLGHGRSDVTRPHFCGPSASGADAPVHAAGSEPTRPARALTQRGKSRVSMALRVVADARRAAVRDWNLACTWRTARRGRSHDKGARGLDRSVGPCRLGRAAVHDGQHRAGSRAAVAAPGAGRAAGGSSRGGAGCLTRSRSRSVQGLSHHLLHHLPQPAAEDRRPRPRHAGCRRTWARTPRCGRRWSSSCTPA